MIPFDLSKLDGSSAASDHAHSKTITRLLDISKLYLGVTDKSRDAAVLLCARYRYNGIIGHWEGHVHVEVEGYFT